MHIGRASAKGFNWIHLTGLMVLTLCASALVIDFGFYFTAQNQLQTSADASALAATDELYRSNSLDPMDRRSDASYAASDYVDRNQPGILLDSSDVTFGFVDSDTRQYNSETFETVSTSPDYVMTGGVNAVRVAVRRTDDSSNGPLQTIMAQALNIPTMQTGAFSVAMLERSIGSVSSGLRPIYACEPQVTMAMADGNPENNVIRIYGDRMMVDGVSNLPGCPAPGSGNWGFADLRNCDPDAPGSNDTAQWFASGFEGTVFADECYSTQTGNFISNSGVKDALDQLIANETVITIPVYDEYSGGGSNTNVRISGFTGFVVTGYQANGSANNRYIEGYFKKTVCRDECSSGEEGSGSGGLMVKLRLASQS